MGALSAGLRQLPRFTSDSPDTSKERRAPTAASAPVGAFPQRESGAQSGRGLRSGGVRAALLPVTGRAGGRRPDRRVARLALAAAAALLLLAIAGWQLASWHGNRDVPAGNQASTAPGRAAPVRGGALGDIPARGLALGITEPNPALVWSPAARRRVPAPFERWRDTLGETRPELYRLMVSWRQLQPEPGGPIDLDAFQSGCLRDRGPCAPWNGVREQLAALASRQREGGWVGVVVLSDTPDWAATAATACDAPGAESRSRAPRRAALAEYQAVVRALLAAAAAEGAVLPYWSAWNEPNHPYFLARQSGDCDGSDGSSPDAVSSAADYADLVRALDAVLATAPRTERVLGELAAILRPGGEGTDVESFIAALPSDLVCSSAVFTQHSYAGGRNPVPAVSRALAGHACPARTRIWITETGAGLPGVSLSAGARSSSRPEACRELHARLRAWWEDPRVDVAIQYTMREDDLFRVGLVRTDLSAAWPTLAVWRAWSRRRNAGMPPPALGCLPGR